METNYKFLFIVSFVGFLGASVVAFSAINAFNEISGLIR